MIDKLLFRPFWKCGRKKHRVCTHNLAVHLRASVYRAIIIIKISGKPYHHFEVLGKTNVHVGTERIALQIDVVVKIVSVINL